MGLWIFAQDLASALIGPFPSPEAVQEHINFLEARGDSAETITVERAEADRLRERFNPVILSPEADRAQDELHRELGAILAAPIIGNAFSDMGLMNRITAYVLNPHAGMYSKRSALQKLDEVMGRDEGFPSVQAVEDYVAEYRVAFGQEGN